MKRFTDRTGSMRQRTSIRRILFTRKCLRILTVTLFAVSVFFSGCAQIRLPQIDPTGNSIFLPRGNSTELLTPGTVRNRNNPLRGLQPPPSLTFPSGQLPGGTLQGIAPFTPPPALPTNSYPTGPAFTHPADPPPCEPGCNAQTCSTGTHRGGKHIIPHPGPAKTTAENGKIIMTPSRIIAPVGSEVVVLAGICGGDGYYVTNQPLEWILSNDSVGQFIEVGGTHGPHPTVNQLLPPSAKKFDGNYAWGRTGLKDILLTRGTPTPVDDIQLLKGQTFTSVSSASPGTSYVTAVAPNAAAWDKRRESTTIHWVDGLWSIPTPTSATAGTVHPMTTRVNRVSDGRGVKDWLVRYTIVSGAPAEFAPTGSQTAVSTTDPNGEATVQLRQIAGRFEPGTTCVRVDVVRPAAFGQPELQVESGITNVTWSAPALTIRAIGPRTAGTDEAFNYRIEVSNPGDQVSRGVVVRTQDFGGNTEFISSTPKPTQYGNRYEWQLGDIPPGAGPAIIDIQLKSRSRGNVNMCFEVESLTDGLQTEACAQTEISVPCIGLEIEGPSTANVGQEVEFNLLVVNQCDEPLTNLELVINYDEGLHATGLGRPIRYPIDVLQFGEPQRIPVRFQILQPGLRCFKLAVTADSGHTVNAERCIEAVIPVEAKVDLRIEGQQRTAVGQTALVRGIVHNIGNSPIEDAILTVRNSGSLKPDEVTRDFPQGWLNREMAFNIGRVEPGEEKIVEIYYLGVAPDGNAFSEMTITSATTEASDTERINIRVEPETGPIGIPPGNRPPAGQSGSGAPRVPPSQMGDLRIDVRALSREVRVGDTVEFQFVVANDRSVPDQNLRITMLIPPGMEYFDFDPRLGGLKIEGKEPDLTRFYLGERLEIRPGEQLQFTITLRAVQPGTGTFEVQATSALTAGTAYGRDTVTISQ